MTAPQVSVVMGVRDGAEALRDSLDSVLSQQGVELEVVVVDDGSTDSTRELVRAAASDDRRVRLLEQPPSGLTAALVRGCAAARGAFIARQDCGDRSLPNRLAILAKRLADDSRVVLVTGGTRVLGPEGEPLFEHVQTSEGLRSGLAARRPRDLAGPSHHGCVLFRRAAYEAVGGYRAAFRVAQDLDLWLRLAEVGTVEAVPEVLYEARWSSRSISSLHRDRQVAAARLAWRAAQRRRAGESEVEELARVERVTAKPLAGRRRRQAAADYFVGSCLRERDPGAARRYFERALTQNPLHLKAWLRWLTTGS